MISVQVSLGELMDKISILRIKKKNITDKQKLIYINEELTLLEQTLKNFSKDKKIEEYLDKLFSINSSLWQIEDDIRDCERQKLFNKKFVELARSVYLTNDKRSEN
jgi:hypothetical protein